MSIDSVSWHLLGQEFGRALEIVDRGQPPSDLALEALLAKEFLLENEGGFPAFVARLSELAEDQEYLEAQKDFWVKTLDKIPEPLSELTSPEGEADLLGAKLGSPPDSFELVLSPAETKNFLARSKSNPEIALLAAVVFSANQVVRAKALLTLLESHGREPIFEDLDLVSTIGWFTSLYPLVLKAGVEYPSNLIAVGRTMREVPQGGIGYGILRRLANDPAAALGRRADLIFNYQGQVSGERDDNAKNISLPNGALMVESLGTPYDLPPGFVPPAALSVNAYLIDGRLKTRWSFDGNRTIDLRRLAETAARLLS
jgi:non-ribosomal peptide synthase protein (TIGR01720 family)